MNNTENTQLDALVASVGNLNRDQQEMLVQAVKASRKKPASAGVSGRKILGVLVTVAVLAGGGTAVWAAAQNDRGSSDILSGGIIVPYDGFVTLGSDPLNDTRDVIFELYDDPSAGDLIWTETQSVTFYNGRFSVGLGSETSIDNAILDADKLYLAIKIEDGEGTPVTLAGRQAIEPVPYAAWSAHAADLNVAGDLSVEGDVTGSLNVTGGLEVTGGDLVVSNPYDLSFGADVRQMLNLHGEGYGIGVQSSTQYFRTNGGFAWYGGGSHHNNQNNAGGGTTLMKLSSAGKLDVTGDLNVGGDVTGVSLTVSREDCETFETSCVDVNPSVLFLVGTTNAECESNQFLTSWRLKQGSISPETPCNQAQMYIEYKCCNVVVDF